MSYLIIIIVCILSSLATAPIAKAIKKRADKNGWVRQLKSAYSQ